MLPNFGPPLPVLLGISCSSNTCFSSRRHKIPLQPQRRPMDTRSRIFPARIPKAVPAGLTNPSSERLRNLPLSHQLQPQLRRLFSHIKARSAAPKATSAPIQFTFSRSTHGSGLFYKSAQQHSSRTNQLQWISRSCTRGRSKVPTGAKHQQGPRPGLELLQNQPQPY